MTSVLGYSYTGKVEMTYVSSHDTSGEDYMLVSDVAAYCDASSTVSLFPCQMIKHFKQPDIIHRILRRNSLL